MPYVTPERRKELHEGDSPKNGGDLNYIMTTMIASGQPMKKVTFTKLFQEFWLNLEKPSYNTGINVIGGAVLNCAMEFQRRAKMNNYRFGLQAMGDAYVEWYATIAGPYEDTKITENGDVFK